MKTHKYSLTIEFESELPVKKHADALIQFENGLGHFVDTPATPPFSSINSTFVYGTGKTVLKKLTLPKSSTARKHSTKRKSVKNPDRR